jgi:pimeloyl-ACP methyl ester carboxylesterase
MVKSQQHGRMPTATTNGIEICFDTVGDPSDPTVLLVMGLGSQMIHWDPELCRMIADRGFQVVRYDNRDTGLSTRFDDPVDVLELLTWQASGRGTAPPAPYLLSDMAADAVGVLDHLGVDRAHVAGVSMGGMIVQTLAIDHPDRLVTMTSIMSTTGDRDVGLPTQEALAQLMAPPAQTREQYQDAAVRYAHVWGSPGLFEEPRVREVAGQAWDRGYDPRGVARQIAAIVTSGSRSELLAAVAIPSLVIHGTADTLVHVSGGERTADVIPDAKLMIIDGMGHDLAPPLWSTLVDAVCGFASAHGA